MRHLISITDFTAAELNAMLDLGAAIKADFVAGTRKPLLPGRVCALLFEKPSLRTRVSFEAGMIQLGGGSMFLSDDVGFNSSRESIADFGRVLGSLVDVVVVRAKSHKTVTELAKYTGCPVVNGLTDHDHPCQALADIFTLRELHGKNLSGGKVAFIGDANNVSRSLLELCAFEGIEFAISGPPAYRFEDEEIAELKKLVPTLKYSVYDDPAEAVKGSLAVYTDVWTSMGQEAENAKRLKVFAPYQVNGALMKLAPDAYFLHCLPARRGEEVTDEVMDSPRSAVVQQAENRMHAQKGALAWLLGAK